MSISKFFKNTISTIKCKPKDAKNLGNALEKLANEINTDRKKNIPMNKDYWVNLSYTMSQENTVLKKYIHKSYSKPHSIAGKSISLLYNALHYESDDLTEMNNKVREAFLLTPSDSLTANTITKRFSDLSNAKLGRNWQKNKKGLMDNRKTTVKTAMEYDDVAKAAIKLIKAIEGAEISDTITQPESIKTETKKSKNKLVKTLSSTAQNVKNFLTVKNVTILVFPYPGHNFQKFVSLVGLKNEGDNVYSKDAYYAKSGNSYHLRFKLLDEYESSDHENIKKYIAKYRSEIKKVVTIVILYDTSNVIVDTENEKLFEPSYQSNSQNIANWLTEIKKVNQAPEVFIAFDDAQRVGNVMSNITARGERKYYDDFEKNDLKNETQCLDGCSLDRTLIDKIMGTIDKRKDTYLIDTQRIREKINS